MGEKTRKGNYTGSLTSPFVMFLLPSFPHSFQPSCPSSFPTFLSSLPGLGTSITTKLLISADSSGYQCCFRGCNDFRILCRWRCRQSTLSSTQASAMVVPCVELRLAASLRGKDAALTTAGKHGKGFYVIVERLGDGALEI